MWMFKCPRCGAILEDDGDNLKCEHCGGRFRIELTDLDKTLNYLKEKDIRELDERTEKEDYRRKESRKANWILGSIMAVGLVLIYLIEKGIL